MRQESNDAALAGPAPARRAWIAVGVFCVVLAVHGFSGVHHKADSLWTLPTAMSLWAHGSADLSAYPAAGDPRDYRLERAGGRVYNAFPAGTSILSLPFVAVADAGCRIVRGESYEEALKRSPHSALEPFIASVFVALASALIFLMADRRLKSVPLSLVLVLVFAFCTSAWSTASRALWSHGPSMLMLSAALYCFLRAKEKPGLLFWAGLALAFAFVVRPTNVVSVAAFSVLVLARYRRGALSYFIALAFVGVLFVAFNADLYGKLLPDYFSAGRLGFHEHFDEALAGNLISPARGLFIYSPVLLFAIAGVAIAWRRGLFGALDRSLAVIVVLHWLVISAYAHWWGGHSYGPRLFTDMLPFLVWLMIPAVEMFRRPWGRRARAWLAVFVVLAAFSGFVHFRGATHGGCIGWNPRPVDVDQHPERLWDWSDPAFLR